MTKKGRIPFSRWSSETCQKGSPDLASSLVLEIKEGSVSRAVLGRALRRRVEIGSFLFVFCFTYRLFEFEGAGVELVVFALFGDQGFVVATLDDMAVFKDHDRLTVLYGRQTVCDYKYRTVLHLYYYEGYSIKEIAAILEIPSATVGTILARGREKLREALQDQF